MHTFFSVCLPSIQAVANWPRPEMVLRVQHHATPPSMGLLPPRLMTPPRRQSSSHNPALNKPAFPGGCAAWCRTSTSTFVQLPCCLPHISCHTICAPRQHANVPKCPVAPNRPMLPLCLAQPSRWPSRAPGLQLVAQAPVGTRGGALRGGLAVHPVHAMRGSPCGEVQPLDVVQLPLEVHPGRAPLQAPPCLSRACRLHTVACLACQQLHLCLTAGAGSQVSRPWLHGNVVARGLPPLCPPQQAPLAPELAPGMLQRQIPQLSGEQTQWLHEVPQAARKAHLARRLAHAEAERLGPQLVWPAVSLHA